MDKPYQLKAEARFRATAITFAELAWRFRRSKEASTFEEIYTLLKAPLCNYFSSRFDLAEDSQLAALHDTMLVIIEAGDNSTFAKLLAESLSDEESAKKLLRWIFGIAKRKAIDEIRFLSNQPPADHESAPPYEALVDGEVSELFAQLSRQLHGNQKLVADAMLEILPNPVKPSQIRNEVFRIHGALLSGNSIKRALEEVRRKFDKLLQEELGLKSKYK